MGGHTGEGTLSLPWKGGMAGGVEGGAPGGDRMRPWPGRGTLSS